MTGYRVCREVVHETVDDEVVLIHLGTGVYYSIRGSGVPIWEGVVAGAPTDLLVAGDPARAPGFVAALAEEGLIEPAPAVAPAWRPDSAAGGGPPLFERFTDMEDLLLLDPVHEVDAQGWPHTPA